MSAVANDEPTCQHHIIGHADLSQHSRSMSLVQQYFETHHILAHIEDVVQKLSQTTPDDPMLYLSNYFNEKSSKNSPLAFESRVSFYTLIPDEPTEGSKSTNLTVCSQNHLVYDLTPPTESTQVNEVKMPEEEVDHTFTLYLSTLASSVRRSTS